MKETKPVKIYGMEAYTKRMQKAIEEAEFKRAMTERSNFTASSGVKKAKTLVKSLSKQVLLPTPTFNMDKKHKFSSHFGDTDGMKIVKQRVEPSKLKDKVPIYSNQQRKFKESTL